MADLDIAAFLRARLDEREADSSGPPDSDSVHALGCDLNTDGWPVVCSCGEPEFVLADVAAKRQLVAMYEASAREAADDPNDDEQVHCARGLRYAVELLALPYAEHPDYREEWKP